MANLFEKRKEYVKQLYAENELNHNLTLEQHKAIQELQTIRHKVHNSGYKVYTGKPMSVEVREFFNKPEEYWLNLGLPYPKTAIKLFKNMETLQDLNHISKLTEAQVRASAKSFLEEKEFLNEILQNYTRDIDLAYGTHYCPHGSWRRNNTIDYISRDLDEIADAFKKGNFYEYLDNYSQEKLVTNIHMEYNNSVNRLTGMYESTPFSAYITSSGKAVDIQMHTPKQDLEASEEVKKEIVKECMKEYELHKNDVKIKKTKALIVGMDGTLADLNKGVIDVNGRIHMENIYKVLEKPGFFKTLEPIKPMVEAIRHFIKNHPEVEVYVLSTAKPDDPPGVPAQKNEWLNRNIPELSIYNRLFVSPDVSKAEFVLENKELECYMVDDNLKYLQEFEEAGGKAIQSVSGKDSVHKYVTLNYENNARFIYKELERLTNSDSVDIKREPVRKRNIDIER